MALLKIECKRDFSAVSVSCRFSSVSGDGGSSGLNPGGRYGCQDSSSLSIERELVSNSDFSTAIIEEGCPLRRAVSRSFLSDDSFDRQCIIGQRDVDIPNNVSTSLSDDFATGAPVGGKGCKQPFPGACDNGAVPKDNAAITS